jgi:hypothetical protein
VAIDGVIEKKLDALLKIESQFVEGGCLAFRNPLPAGEEAREARRQAAREGFRRRFASIADKHRDKLIAVYGDEEGKQVRYAEAFELCEYGARPSPADLRRLFPFFPEEK